MKDPTGGWWGARPVVAVPIPPPPRRRPKAAWYSRKGTVLEGFLESGIPRIYFARPREFPPATREPLVWPCLLFHFRDWNAEEWILPQYRVYSRARLEVARLTQGTIYRATDVVLARYCYGKFPAYSWVLSLWPLSGWLAVGWLVVSRVCQSVRPAYARRQPR